MVEPATSRFAVRSSTALDHRVGPLPHKPVSNLDRRPPGVIRCPLEAGQLFRPRVEVQPLQRLEQGHVCVCGFGDGRAPCVGIGRSHGLFAPSEDLLDLGLNLGNRRGRAGDRNRPDQDTQRSRRKA